LFCWFYCIYVSYIARVGVVGRFVFVGGGGGGFSSDVGGGSVCVVIGGGCVDSCSFFAGVSYRIIFSYHSNFI